MDISEIFALVKRLENGETIDRDIDAMIQKAKVDLDSVTDPDMIKSFVNDPIIVNLSKPEERKAIEVFEEVIREANAQGKEPNMVDVQTKIGSDPILQKIISEEPPSPVAPSPVAPVTPPITPPVVPKPKSISIDKVEPEQSNENGGTKIVITGTGLDTITEIKIGTQKYNSTDFTIKSPTSIKLKTIAEAVGNYDIVIKNATGESDTYKNKFAFVPFEITKFTVCTDNTCGTKVPAGTDVNVDGSNNYYGKVVGTGLENVIKITITIIITSTSAEVTIDIPQSDFKPGYTDKQIIFKIPDFTGTSATAGDSSTKNVIAEDANGNKTTGKPWTANLIGGNGKRRIREGGRRTFTVPLRKSRYYQRGGNDVKKNYLKYIITVLKSQLDALRSRLPALIANAKTDKPIRTDYTDIARKFIAYYIGELNTYDIKLFKFLEQFKLDVEPTMMIYFTMKKQDLVPIIKKYMPAYSYAIPNIIKLKKLSAYEKFKKNYGVNDVRLLYNKQFMF